MNKEYAEKVNAMTDEQLCDCVAEFINWQPCKLCCDGGEIDACIEGLDKDYDCTVLSKGGSWETCSMAIPSGRPDWANDIAAAWALAESNPDWRWSIYELDNGDWCASPMEVIGVRGEYCLWDHVSEATGETAQRAITKAFILAIEVE